MRERERERIIESGINGKLSHLCKLQSLTNIHPHALSVSTRTNIHPHALSVSTRTMLSLSNNCRLALIFYMQCTKGKLKH